MQEIKEKDQKFSLVGNGFFSLNGFHFLFLTRKGESDTREFSGLRRKGVL